MLLVGGGEVDSQAFHQVWPVTCAGVAEWQGLLVSYSSILRDSQPSSSTAHKFLHYTWHTSLPLAIDSSHSIAQARPSDLDKSTNPVSLLFHTATHPHSYTWRSLDGTLTNPDPICDWSCLPTAQTWTNYCPVVHVHVHVHPGWGLKHRQTTPAKPFTTIVTLTVTSHHARCRPTVTDPGHPPSQSPFDSCIHLLGVYSYPGHSLDLHH
jgi:hypothetical protein